MQCINYRRMDDVIGLFHKEDIDQGILDEEEDYRYLKSLWLMVENLIKMLNYKKEIRGNRIYLLHYHSLGKSKYSKKLLEYIKPSEMMTKKIYINISTM